MVGFPLNQKSIFYRQLATLVHSAVPINSAVKTAGIQTCPKLANEMSDFISKGHRLSEVLGRYPFYFSPYEVHMVDSGETSGNLDGQLSDLAESLERSWQLKTQIVSKLVYPLLILHCAVFIPPIFLLVTKGLEAYLTLTLGILIPVYLVAAFVFAVYRLASQNSGLRKFFDAVICALPVLGTPFRTMARARFLDAMAKLNEAGFKVDQAIPLAARACGNRAIGDRIEAAHRAVGIGQPVSATLGFGALFPPLVTTLVVSGEESGNVSPLLSKAAEHLEGDFKAQVHRLMTLLPIMLLLLVGAVVGVIVIGQMKAIMAPIMNL